MNKDLSKTWNYEDAVSELKPMITSWNKKTLEIVRLLYKANQELSHSGQRTDLENMYRSTVTTSAQLRRGSEETKPKNWEQFCNEIGILKSTANRWLALYDADEDRLLTSQEAKQRALEIRDALFEDVRQHRYNGEPEWTPENWSEKLEAQYKLWLIEKRYDEVEADPGYYKSLAADDEDDGMFDYGLFSRSYIADIGKRVTKRTTGDGTVRMDMAAQKYKSRIPEGIRPYDVMRIPELSLAALELFPAEKRKEIAILTAEIYRDLAIEELEGK